MVSAEKRKDKFCARLKSPIYPSDPIDGCSRGAGIRLHLPLTAADRPHIHTDPRDTRSMTGTFGSLREALWSGAGTLRTVRGTLESMAKTLRSVSEILWTMVGMLWNIRETLQSKAGTVDSVRDVLGSKVGTLRSRNPMLRSVAETRRSGELSRREMAPNPSARSVAFAEMLRDRAIQNETLGLDSKHPLSLTDRTKGKSPPMRPALCSQALKNRRKPPSKIQNSMCKPNFGIDAQLVLSATQNTQ